MSITAPNSYVTPASPVVVQQMARLNTNADQLVELTKEAVHGLQTLSFANVDLDPKFQFSQEDLDALIKQLGPLPDVDLNNWIAGLDLSAGNQDFVFNGALLSRLQEALPEFILPSIPNAPALPDAPADPGDVTDPDRPVRPTLNDYAAPDIDFNIPIPEYTDETAAVPFPTLRNITLPTPPVINIDDIKFEGTAPVFTGVVPDAADFSFENNEYSSDLLDKTKATVMSLLDNGKGLPPEVEDAMFEREREREMEVGNRLMQEAAEAWASKGFRYQGGPLARREDRARYEANSKAMQLARERYIENWRGQLEMYRAGISAAIAMEEATMRLFAQAEDRRFQAARMQLDFAIQVFNVQIAKYNADANVFQVQAQVYRDRFSAELAKVQVYSEELKAAQIIGELNAQDVQIFAERLRALQINADIYKAKIDGYTARFQAINAQVNIYRAQLESNASLVQVYESDTRAFMSLVQANQARDERFNVKANIYSKQIDAWKTQYDALLTGWQSNLEKAKLSRDVYASNTDRLRAWAEGETGRVRALSEKYQAIAAEIAAKSDIEKSKYSLALSVAQASIERMRAASDILLKNGEINIQSGLTAAGLMLRAQETATTTLAQLAAGMTSAANVNASISDSSGSSLSYNFSGELEVA